MKLNRKHLHALDIGINKVLDARDKSNDPDTQDMLTNNANRLRQLRILMMQVFVQPSLDFDELVWKGIPESTNLVKGIRLLTGYPDDSNLAQVSTPGDAGT